MKKRIRIDDKRYLLIANTIRNRNISISEDEDKVSVYIYLIDRTVEYELKRKYVNEKQMLQLSILIIMMMYCNVSMTTSNNRFWHKIRKCINEWVDESNALLKSNRPRQILYVL